MKKSILSLFIFGLAQVANAQGINDFSGVIQADTLKKYLTFIASDSLKGRDTGSEEQKIAALFIAKHFEKAGLKGIASNGFLQPLHSLVKKQWADVYIKINDVTYRYLEDFFGNSLEEINQEIPLELVKITSLTTKKETKGKFVLIPGIEEVSLDEQEKLILLAKKKGARGALVLSAIAPKIFEVVIKEEKKKVEKAYKKGRIDFLGDEEALPTNKFSVIQLSPAMSEAIVVSKEKMAIKIAQKSVPVDTYNVMGYLEGTDKKEETIIITAHYDHIGVSEDGQINNGADDDGSGTVAVIQLAEAFGKAAQAGIRPRRSILFMTFTGEEKGLFGSEYYVKNPIIPLKNTVCNLNIDMIGRTDPIHEEEQNENYIYVIGSDKISYQLYKAIEDQNEKHFQMTLDYRFNDPKDPNRFYYRSDHYNFAKNGIPVAFFFDGVHKDYHKPTDDVDKIEFDRIEKVAKLVFFVASDISNRGKRLIIDNYKP